MKSSKGVRIAISVAMLSLAAVTSGFVGVTMASAATPKLNVAPATNLKKGEAVTVTGSGFTPGDTVYVVECLKNAKGEAGCDISIAVPATITAGGALPKTKIKVTTGKIGSGKCGTTAGNLKNCAISAGNASGGDSAVKDITFKALKK
jgi:Neocarzinostatin family